MYTRILNWLGLVLCFQLTEMGDEPNRGNTQTYKKTGHVISRGILPEGTTSPLINITVES